MEMMRKKSTIKINNGEDEKEITIKIRMEKIKKRNEDKNQQRRR
jgi:hypothetical protein